MAAEVLLLCPLYEPTQRALENAHRCHRLWEAPDRAALLRSLAHIEVAASSSGVGIDAATLDALPALKLVANFGVGVDTYDLADCARRGVTVTNTPDVLTDEVADLALGLLLATVRQIPQGDRWVRDGRWLKGGLPLTHTMRGRRVGVVGLGRIGQAIAKRCAAFGVQVGYFGPRRKAGFDYRYFDDIVALGQWADTMIAACPGGPQTHHLISREALAALGEQGIFVNIARGSVVDQQALTELLQSGTIGAAGLDVFDDEPNVPQALIDLEHCVLLPHVGSASVHTRLAMGQLVVDNVQAYVDGRPLLTPAN
ncbi:MAG: 2-hydroxyacid dehydrogenase [Burkholderiaceae bacterium]